MNEPTSNPLGELPAYWGSTSCTPLVGSGHGSKWHHDILPTIYIYIWVQCYSTPKKMEKSNRNLKEYQWWIMSIPFFLGLYVPSSYACFLFFFGPLVIDSTKVLPRLLAPALFGNLFTVSGAANGVSQLIRYCKEIFEQVIVNDLDLYLWIVCNNSFSWHRRWFTLGFFTWVDHYVCNFMRQVSVYSTHNK